MKKVSSTSTKKHQTFKMIIAAVAILALAAGSTFAWFTSKGEVEQQIVMGSLKIDTTFTPLDPADTTGYEPGGSIELPGSITNNGSLPAFIKVNNAESQIKFKYDANGAVIPDADQVFEDIDSDAIKMNIAPTSGKYEDNDDAIWFVDAQGTKYLILTEGSSVNVSVSASFDGPTMDNRYQESTIKIEAETLGTQVLPEAMQDVLGVDINDLEGLSDDTTRSSSNRAMDKLNELIQRAG